MAPLANSTNWAAPVAMAVLWNCFTWFSPLRFCASVFRDAGWRHVPLNGGATILIRSKQWNNCENHQHGT
jgi:hypothetical protein